MTREWNVGDRVGFVAYPGELSEFFVNGTIAEIDTLEGKPNYHVTVDGGDEYYEVTWADIKEEMLIDTSSQKGYLFRSSLQWNHFRVFATWSRDWRDKPIS